MQLFDNYRPTFGKIFEKIIYNRLNSSLASKGMIYKKQFGFRKHQSIAHAINHSINKIINELQQLKNVLYCYGIFINLSKAFDTIDHNKLIVKFEHCGLRGSCHKLLTYYLLKREQYINFKSTNSDVHYRSQSI